MSMKLCVHVLLLALGVISGHKCDESNECDFSSHLHVATKTPKVSYLISEFQPNPTGLVQDAQKVELSGPPNTAFEGCIWSVEADGLPSGTAFGQVMHGFQWANGTFDANGLLAVAVPELENPSFTLFLSQSCPPGNVNIHDNTAAFLRDVGTIYDSIGVPDSAADASNLPLIRTALNNPAGTDLGYIGTEPKLVFREASTGDLYQVDDQGKAFQSFVFDANAKQVPTSEFDPDPRKKSLGAINPTRFAAMAAEGGDPHIYTLDGGHYTLLREGSFLLWRFGLPQPKVEWQIFAHYAGHQSFAKGLLLVDTSGSEPSSMEITSEHCEWQTQSDSKKWSSVNSEASEVLPSGPFSSMQLFGSQGMKKVQLFIADEKVPVATLKVMCRQGHHINMKLYMANEKWRPFVSGELKGQKGQEHKPSSNPSMLQLVTREDQEFEVKKPWSELGGSPHAQQYLQNFDEHGQNAGFSQVCDTQAQADARALCQKHLGTAAHSSYFEECVYDVCSGAGEVAAEMAAEMLKF